MRKLIAFALMLIVSVGAQAGWEENVALASKNRLDSWANSVFTPAIAEGVLTKDDADRGKFLTFVSLTLGFCYDTAVRYGLPYKHKSAITQVISTMLDGHSTSIPYVSGIYAGCWKVAMDSLGIPVHEREEFAVDAMNAAFDLVLGN